MLIHVADTQAITFAPGCGNTDRIVKSKTSTPTVAKDYRTNVTTGVCNTSPWPSVLILLQQQSLMVN